MVVIAGYGKRARGIDETVLSMWGYRHLAAIMVLVVAFLDGGGVPRWQGQPLRRAETEQRPRLRTADRTRFAGRILMAPAGWGDEPGSGFGDLKTLAELADHDLQLAPGGPQSSPESILEWIRINSGIETDGLIVDPEIAGTERVDDTLAMVRRQRPYLPIDSARDPATGIEAGLSLRLARMISHRLGESARILPFYTEAGHGSVRQTISRMIEQVGAAEIRPDDRASGPPDLLLFVVLPGTTSAGHERLVDGVRRSLGRNIRVAIADLTTDRASKERLFALLRQERWIDRLAGIAGSDPERLERTGDAAARAIAQAVLFTASIHSLRDDENQLGRIDRARARLLLIRCLREFSYPLHVRPSLSGVGPSEIERLARTQLESLAVELFNEQFRRNLHTTRLVTGRQVQFEISLLQQVRFRFSAKDTALAAPEIFPTIHLAVTVAPAQSGREWEVTNDALDQRVRERWTQIPWGRYETGAKRVLVTFRGAPADAVDSPEGYRLRFRLNRKTPRVDISATTDRARVYALNRLARLGAGGNLTADIDLTESPQFAERGIVDDRGGEWSLRERIDLINLLGRLRMNRYVLVMPEGLPRITADSLARLQQAAERAFVDLTVADKIPPDTRKFTPENVAPCFAPVRGLASVPLATVAEASRSMLVQPAGPAYSTWLRIASIAELAWNPAGYRAERSAEYLLAGEGPEINERFRPLVGVGDDCVPGKLPALAITDMIPGNGRRTLSLLRGELLQRLR